MEEMFLSSSLNNDGKILKLEIKQKSAYIKKRKVKTWTPEEDQRLVYLYEQYPKKWSLIASLMSDRNENQCLHRYRRLSQLGAHKKIWSSQEDKAILTLVKKVGKNWKLLSEIIGTKTGKQIRQRFINKLDPKIKNEDWTDEEDKLILKYYYEFGSRWSEISRKLPGRPENKIKNRFYSYIQKNYDIRYSLIDPEEVIPEKAPDYSHDKVTKQVEVPEKVVDEDKVKQPEIKYQGNQIPSLKELDDDYRLSILDQQDYEYGSQIISAPRLYLRSLIRMDQDMIESNQYRSIRDVLNHEMLGNDNDLFYLTN